MSCNNSKLLVKPDYKNHEYITISPKSAGWEHLHFQAVKLHKGEEWSFETGMNELALIILSGSCNIISNHGEWNSLGSRKDVFHGMPTVLYLSRNTSFTVHALTPELDFACGWAAASKDFPACVIKPEDVIIELRGGENASRQINQMIPPGLSL